MRRASCRSVPMMCRPPSCFDFLPFGLHLLALLDLVDQRVPFLLRHVEPRGVLVLQQGPGHRLGIAAEDDVGAAAGHVRGDRHGALAAGLGDDLGLALVMLGVEHLVLDAALVQQRREPLALFDRHGADQHRPAAAAAMSLDLVARDRLALACLRVELRLRSLVVFAGRSCRRSSSPSFSSTRVPALCIRSISSAMALNFSRSLR